MELIHAHNNVLGRRTDGGLMWLLLSKSAAGVMVRRLLPAALVVPMGLGWLQLQGQYAGWFGTEAGVALFVLAHVVVFGALIWANAALLQRSDTERQQAEDALRTSQDRTRAIVEIALDGIITMDHMGRIVDFDPAAERLFGHRSQEVIGRTLVDVIISPARRDEHVRSLAHYLATSEGPARGSRIEMTGRRADGAVIPIELSIARMPGTGPPLFTGFVRDITERKLAEDKIQAQVTRLALLSQITRAISERQDPPSIFQVVVRTLEDQLPLDFSCVCSYDAPGNALTVTSIGLQSKALARELAMTEHARIAIDQNGFAQYVQGQLVYEPDISQAAFPLPHCLARGGLRSLVAAPLLVESTVFGLLIAARRQPHSFSSGECEFLQQVSEHVALATHQAHLYGALQRAHEDMRQTQQVVMQQERLRVLGQMTSGIAHDINNALAPVAIYTEVLLEREPTLSARARRYLETIQHAIDDVAETIAHLREFYRQNDTPLALAPVYMNPLVHQVVDLTRARWSTMPQQRGVVIDLQTELAPELPTIMGVESELREALINLVFNAVDAMPDGGTLTLRTYLTDSISTASEVPTLRHVHVEVTDTGVGMDEDTQRRCLEPFFTTKGERGTGLGLAMVYGTMQRHGAEMDIASAVGQGTTVRLHFAVPTTPVSTSPQPTGTSAVPSRLRILVVDDDPLLLQALCETLESDGHVVVTAHTGQGGIDAFHTARAGSEAFAVVITDLGMPHIDGREVARAVKEVSPATRVILLTGWGQQLVMDRDVPPHVDHVLNKPPKLRELHEILARL
jgi:PAS domain S-box-containing protein